MNLRNLLTIFLLLLFISGCFPSAKINLISDTSEPLVEFTIEGSGKEKILILPVTGVINNKPEKGLLGSQTSLVQEVLAQLNKAKNDPFVKAVVLKVDSPGGTVTASDILYNEIKKFRDSTKKPIIVSIINVGASGAYYLSLPADQIYAHPTSVVGSVGVIFMRPKFHSLMEKIGISVAVSKSGLKKDMGSPFKELSEEEEKFCQNITDKLAERFFSLVELHRQLPTESLNEIKTAAVYLPLKAKELGLIDAIGYLPDAVESAKKAAKITGKARIITYRRNEYSNDTIYNTTGAVLPPWTVTNVKVPGLSTEAGFYYLSPVFK